MPNPRSSKLAEVRIIAGQYRGRKIYFPALPGLRPTPNRIRETLFNWLARAVEGASCLDLFAGSGALSFEALSRGAKYCLLLDACPEVAHRLCENQARIGIRNMAVQCATFPYASDVVLGRYDIVFIDPPFQEHLVPSVIRWLLACDCLAKNALIYIESDSHETTIQTPESWQVLKSKKAGNVHYSLLGIREALY
jgi:16S rRNA (guanine966-N2)-methyltransferase